MNLQKFLDVRDAIMDGIAIVLLGLILLLGSAGAIMFIVTFVKYL